MTAGDARTDAIAAADWPPAARVAFHDAECHGYDADLGLWRELAAAADGPVLDVGAGTGRVALDLAAHGHDVTAVDVDPVLLEALRARSRSRMLPVRTVRADAQALPDPGVLAPYHRLGVGMAPTAASGATAEGREPFAGFALVLVPMQTVQLLDDRRALFAGIRRVLVAGGTAALAIADEVAPFDGADGTPLPDPDVLETGDGRRYESQPLAVRVLDDRARIERLRSAVDPDGRRTMADDVIELRHVDAAALHDEAAAAGLGAAPVRRIAPTDDHVGSAVVVLRG